MPPEVPRNAPSIATSIGAAQATVQGLDVLRRSRGAAVTIGDDDLRRWVVTLAAKEGIWPEASSVAPFAAIERLRAEGTIAPHERCVALADGERAEGSRSDRDGAARAAAGQWRPDRADGRAQERLRICPWLSSASPWTAARRSPTSRPRPRRRRRAAPRPCGSPAISICAIPSPWRRWRWAPRRRIKIALMAMSPYSAHPVFIAMAAATLDEMYPGRVILCLGAGAPADLKAAGIEATKPLVTHRRDGEDLPRAAGRRDGRFPGPGVPGLRPAAGQWRPQRADRAGGVARPHAEARRPRERRRADLGRDLAALREGLPCRGGRRRPGRSARSASSTPSSAPRRRKASIRSAGRSASCCAAPIMPRTSACRGASARPGGARHGLCGGELGRGRSPGERRRRAPPRRLRHARPGAGQARRVSRHRPRRGRDRWHG